MSHGTPAAPADAAHGHAHDAGHGHEAEHHHDHSARYFKTFGALMVLTFITVAVAMVDLGFLNLAVALAVACTKATLVILFFMHVIDADKLVKVTVIAGFVWLVIMFVFTIQDFATRGWYSAPAFDPGLMK